MEAMDGYIHLNVVETLAIQQYPERALNKDDHKVSMKDLLSSAVLLINFLSQNQTKKHCFVLVFFHLYFK